MQIIRSQYIDPVAVNVVRVGGKALNLRKMQKQGFPVPDFFVLPSETIDGLLAPARNGIEEICLSLGDKQDKDLGYWCDEIQKKILAIKIPDSFSKELREACQTIAGKDFFVAVRSSAVAEDGSKTSFAGQHASYLYTGKEELSRNLLKTISSAWSCVAVKYRLIHKLTLGNTKFAVVIQGMVDAEKSGIGFSMNLKGNMADMILVAGYGLGEGIVSDRVESDTYTVNRESKTIEKEIPSKYFSLAYKEGEGILNTPVEKKLEKLPVLNDSQIFEVSEYLAQAEKLLQAPADVEFSFDKKGKLYILQMRPVTTLDRDKVKILDNTNIVESYPGITLPLTFSFVIQAYEKVFSGSAEAFMVSAETVKEYSVVFENLLAHFQGRVYYRLDNWYRMVALVHNSRKSMEAWENAVGLTEGESDKIRFSFRGKARAIISSARLIFGYKRGNKLFFKLFHRHYALLGNYSRHLSSPARLWNHYEEATALLFKPWYLTIVNDFIAFKSFGGLQGLLKKYKIGENAELANDLLCGGSGVESEEAILKVLELKEEIKNNAELVVLFTQPETEVLFALKQEKYRGFYQQVSAYLEIYGDRTLAELKLETRSLRRNPEIFIRMLKNQLLSSTTASGFAKQQKQIRSNAENKITEHLRWWGTRRIILNAVLQLARYGLKNRENMRFCRTRAYSAVKDIFLEIGQMMVQKDILESPEDVFYLDLQDLKSFCLEGNLESKVRRIHAAKEQYRLYNELNLPDRIMYMNDDLPVFHKKHIEISNSANFFKGIAVSNGLVVAEAAVITEPKLDMDVRGKILISKMTDPGWIFLMAQAAGLVSEKGSLLSHTAIVGRELGIPVVVGITGATSVFKSGDKLRLDGNAGTVEFMSITN